MKKKDQRRGNETEKQRRRKIHSKNKSQKNPTKGETTM